MELLACELTCGKVVDQLRAHSSNLQHLGKTILFDVNRSLITSKVFIGHKPGGRCSLF